MKGIEQFTHFLHKLAEKTYRELGDGFDEDIYQRALAYEFRRTQVKYLRETNVEVFYLNQMLCLRELDFVIPKQKHKAFTLDEGIIIECKFSSKLVDGNRSQLRQYLKSLPKNQLEEIKSISKGILLNWQKSASYEEHREVSGSPIEIEIWSYNNKDDMRLIKFDE